MHSVWIIGGAFGLFAMWMFDVDARWIGAASVAWLGLTFNSIVSVKNAVDNALSSVSVMLKKRFDLIPSLVDTVQRYVEHESSVLEEIARLRAQASARGVTPEQANALDGQLARAMAQLVATAEAYPELKASENFQQLQRALNEVEEQISAARRTYNAAVKNYNDAVQMFPTNLFAALLSYRARAFFEAPAGHDATPDVMARFRGSPPARP
jgi:LemA protein